MADTDQIDGDDSRVVLMTLHSAKGLEFPVVFLAGCEEGVFPHIRALTEPDELEEERRLAYVGITRAMQRLHVSHAWSRMLFGSTQYNPPSRFLDEIPSELIEHQGDSRRRGGRASSRSWDRGWGENERPARRTSFGSFDPDADERDSHRERIVEAAMRSGNRPAPTGAEKLGVSIGDDVRHVKFGEGVVLMIRGDGDKAEATVRFRDAGTKTLLLSWTPLERIS